MTFILKLLPKRCMSIFVGWIADLRLAKFILRPFLRFYIRLFKVNMDEAIYPLEHYNSVNEFFIRPIKPETRPVSQETDIIVAPVDAVVIEFGKIEDDKALQIKGHPYSIKKLIQNQDLAHRFINGSFVTHYLSPKDYHRIHTPYSGQAIASEYNRGALYPVNDMGLNNIPNLFAINERLTTFLQTEAGLIAMVKVAALNVGRIKTEYPEPFSKVQMKSKLPQHKELSGLSYKKAQEIARFEMGSTVILLFESGRISFLDHIKPGDFLKMGEALAKINKKV